MSDSRQYRAHALECARMARLSPLKSDRESFEALARDWARRADAADRDGSSPDEGTES